MMLTKKKETTIMIGTMGATRLVAGRLPFDLIDVRPREDFNRSHIPGARSIPLNRFTPVKIVHEGKAAKPKPFVIIGEDRVRASLASGMLGGAGCNLPAAVEGG
jgi:rhodanese-related sulfurtransferase